MSQRPDTLKIDGDHWQSPSGQAKLPDIIIPVGGDVWKNPRIEAMPRVYLVYVHATHLPPHCASLFNE